MKKFLVGSLIAFTIFSLSALDVLAQSQSAQNALETVKEKVDNLVTAKDENKTDDLNLRLEAFKKVIDLSLAEAKDLKIKLLAFDQIKDEDTIIWKKDILEDLNKAIGYYEDQKQSLETKENLDLDSIKILGEEFKKWREDNYLNIANQINDFLLIKLEEKAIEVTKIRAEKILNDITKLQKTKIRNTAQLTPMLDKANKTINEAEKLNKDGWILFSEKFIKKPAIELENTSSTKASSTTIIEKPKEDVQILNTTTTLIEASSTDAVPPPQPPSIKDLIKMSLDKIKDSYQTFIEMSSLVRKLLN